MVPGQKQTKLARNKKNESIVSQRYEKKIKILSLSSLPVDWQHVLQCKEWPEIMYLHLGILSTMHTTITTLSRLEWPNLMELNLSQNKIGNSGLKLLANTSMPNLTKFQIQNGNIGDEGLKLMIKFKWPRIFSINMDKNNVKLNGCEVMKLGQWDSLVYIKLYSFSSLYHYCLGDGVLLFQSLPAYARILQRLEKNKEDGLTLKNRLN